MEIVSTPEKAPEKANRTDAVPRIFALVSGAWLAIAGILCWQLSPEGRSAAAILWFVGLWLLSVLDIAALGKTLTAVLGLAGGEIQEPEKRAGAAIRAFYWGFVKLACLGFFALALTKAEAAPGIGLLLGLGTLVIVPLAGGVVWSQRILRNA